MRVSIPLPPKKVLLPILTEKVSPEIAADYPLGSKNSSDATDLKSENLSTTNQDNEALPGEGFLHEQFGAERPAGNLD